ncbi:MAG: hypothetical protein IJQ76_04585 [Prevotella sp.]|nr:hypothetical protein [Prevotella sp.]
MKRLSFILFCSLMATYLFAQNNAYNMGYGWGRYDRGVTALCNGDYSEAYDFFVEGANYHPMCYEGIGVCYELGFGVDVDYDEAWNAYTIGANAGVPACKQAIRRINQNGYWPQSYRKTFLVNLRNAQGVNVTPNVGGYGGSDNSSGSGSAYTTCRICGGSGTCTSCGGRGGEYRDTGYYTGSSIQSWIPCPSCRGSKKCFNCHGTGRQ